MKIEPFVGQPDIQRLLSAFKRKKVDRVPNFEVLLEDQHVQKLLGRHAGNTLSCGGDPAKGVSEGEIGDIDKTLSFGSALELKSIELYSAMKPTVGASLAGDLDRIIAQEEAHRRKLELIKAF